MHESLNHADLLLVAFGKILDREAQIKIEAPRQLTHAIPVNLVSPQIDVVAQLTLYFEAFLHAEFARQIANAAAHCNGDGLGIEPEDADLA